MSGLGVGNLVLERKHCETYHADSHDRGGGGDPADRGLWQQLVERHQQHVRERDKLGCRVEHG